MLVARIQILLMSLLAFACTREGKTGDTSQAKGTEGNAPVAGTHAAAKEGGGGIPGQYVVVLNPGPHASSVVARGRAMALAKLVGVTDVRQVYTQALEGFVFRSSDSSAAARLRANSGVSAVYQDQAVHMTTTQTNPPSWGLDRIDGHGPLNHQYNYTATGDGVDVFVFDSGINALHNDFDGGRASVWKDFMGDGRNGQDCNGHGTHVAGTVGGKSFGVAKAVRLHAARVLDCEGSGAWSAVIAAIDDLTKERLAIGSANRPTVLVNMSLGGSEVFAPVEQAITNSTRAGILYIVAAGNNNTDACSESPAHAAAAMRVGASTEADKRASFSNFGDCLDLFAPGENITSAWIGSPTATNVESGTSMATPHVVGVAALFLQNNRTATPAAIRQALTAATAQSEHIANAQSAHDLLLFTAY
jgi:subtilisin family serine protease